MSEYLADLSGGPIRSLTDTFVVCLVDAMTKVTFAEVASGDILVASQTVCHTGYRQRHSQL